MDGFHRRAPKINAQRTARSVLKLAGKAGSGLLSLVSGLLATVLILYSGYVLYDTFYIQNRAFASSWDVMQYKPEVIEDGRVPLSNLASINEDYRAWLEMDATQIDYPVMQGQDDLYYASHDVYGEASLTGAIYLAAGNTANLSDTYNLIYGHHMDNGAMFGGLDEYLSEDYVLSHKTGTLIAPTRIYSLEVFAVIETDAYESQVYSVGPSRTVRDVVSFLLNPGEKTTVHYYDAEAAGRAVKITALSTCANAETNGRLVVYCMTPEDPTPDPVPTEPAVVTPTEPTVTPPTQPTETEPEEPTEVPAPTESETPNRGTEEIDNGAVPLAPPGQGTAVWALVNLLCVIATAYLLLPLVHLRDKFGRSKLMKQFNATKLPLRDAPALEQKEAEEKALIEEKARALRNEKNASRPETERIAPDAPLSDEEWQEAVDALFYRQQKFRKRFRFDFGGEVLTTVGAIVAFILTEDMRLPMVMIDRWTPLMLVILLAAWIIDVRLARYRDKLLAEQLEQEQAEEAEPMPV